MSDNYSAIRPYYHVYGQNKIVAVDPEQSVLALTASNYLTDTRLLLTVIVNPDDYAWLDEWDMIEGLSDELVKMYGKGWGASDYTQQHPVTSETLRRIWRDQNELASIVDNEPLSSLATRRIDEGRYLPF